MPQRRRAEKGYFVEKFSQALGLGGKARSQTSQPGTASLIQRQLFASISVKPLNSEYLWLFKKKLRRKRGTRVALWDQTFLGRYILKLITAK